MIQDFVTRLTRRAQLTSDVWQFSFELIDPQRIDFIAGQYVILKAEGKSRLYSIASPASQKNSFKLVVKIVPEGLASTYFVNLKIGNTVNFQGPAGVFTLKDNDRDKIFLATGAGIVPIRSMLLSAFGNQDTRYKMQDTRFYLFWGLQTRNDVYFFDDFKTLANDHQSFSFRICLSREQDLDGLDMKYFRSGRVDKHISDDFFAKKVSGQFEYYICGARPVVESLVKYVQDRRVDRENIHFEKFV